MTTATRVTIGGSEAAAACGLDPHRSRVQLWLEKTGRVPGPDESEAMRWGTRLERVIAGVLQDEHGLSLSKVKAAGLFLVPPPAFMHGHPDYYWLNAEDDETGIVEIKTTGPWNARLWAEGTPAQPLLQVQHYLALTGLRLGMVACLIGGQRLVVRRCDRDERIIEHMLRLEEEFVGLVESDTPPDPDARDVEALGLLYPEARAGVVQLTEEDYALAVEFKARKAQLKRVESACDAIKAKLCARLGEYQVGVYEGRPLVKWTEVTSQHAAKDAYESTYRRFTVT
jgi:putative phage-type endonuclease